jgi:hypothetical protein
LLFFLAPSITIFSCSSFNNCFSIDATPSDTGLLTWWWHTRVTYVCVWPCSLHNNPNTGDTKAPVAATILSRNLKQHISTPSSCYHCVLTVLLTCSYYCCNVTFRTVKT